MPDLSGPVGDLPERANLIEWLVELGIDAGLAALSIDHFIAAIRAHIADETNEWRNTAHAARDHYEQSDERLERLQSAYDQLSEEAHRLRGQVDKLNADYQWACDQLHTLEGQLSDERVDSDSMTEPYLECPSCGATIRARVQPNPDSHEWLGHDR